MRKEHDNWFERAGAAVSSKRFTWLAFAVMAVVAQPAVSKDRGVAGTYELLICKGACSFAERGNALGTGVIVLFDRAMKRKDVGRLDPPYDFRHEKANACYALTYPIPHASGVTIYLLDRETLSFVLMRSKDSWYSVRVERKGDVLSGVGNFWSAGVAPPPGYAPDMIVGRWRGPADIGACRRGR
jgi:hypothetical protein